MTGVKRWISLYCIHIAQSPLSLKVDQEYGTVPNAIHSVREWLYYGNRR